MKKWIICAILFVVLFVVGYWTYYFMYDKYLCNGGMSCSLCSFANEIGIEKECVMDYPEGRDEYANRHSCLSYSLDHPYVRCSSEKDNGKIRYCREVRCFSSKLLSENCRTKQVCKD